MAEESSTKKAYDLAVRISPARNGYIVATAAGKFIFDTLPECYTFITGYMKKV